MEENVKTKVFVVTYATYYTGDTALSCGCIGVFSNKEDAQAAMERNIESDNFGEDEIEYHTEDAFSADNDVLHARYEITEHSI